MTESQKSIWFYEVAMKKRAPRAVSEIKQYAQKAMLTKDVRIDTKLNKSAKLRRSISAAVLSVSTAVLCEGLQMNES